MKQKIDRQAILDQIGDPAEIARSLEAYRKDMELAFSKRAEFVKKYPDQWVALFRGKVRAHGTDLPSLIDELKSQVDPIIRTAVRLK